jgi:hypothetical protein
VFRIDDADVALVNRRSVAGEEDEEIVSRYC